MEDNRYKLVKVFVRRSLNISNSKLKKYIVNFDEIEKWKNKINGDELFSAMGTTIKKAGGKEAQYKIDVSYQYEFAKAAAENSVINYFLISSSGAKAKSRIFYLRIKGELEEKVKELPFSKIRIFRPSLLLGYRSKKRFGEKAAERILKIIVPVLPFLKNQRPIEGEKVTCEMIASTNDKNEGKIKIFDLSEIFKLAKI